MKLFDTEYRIEVYAEDLGEWNAYTTIYSSKEDSITTLQLLRECNPEQSYRLCELTISVKVIDE